MILYNPEKGAIISTRVVYNGVKPLDKEFKPGMVMQFDEGFGAFLKGIYGFLEEISVADAKSYMDKIKDYKCDQCDFVTRVEDALVSHKTKHALDAKVAELGIPVVKTKAPTTEDRQKAIDDQAKSEGLEGEGLTVEPKRKRTVMR